MHHAKIVKVRLHKIVKIVLTIHSFSIINHILIAYLNALLDIMVIALLTLHASTAIHIAVAVLAPHSKTAIVAPIQYIKIVQTIHATLDALMYNNSIYQLLLHASFALFPVLLVWDQVITNALDVPVDK